MIHFWHGLNLSIHIMGLDILVYRKMDSYSLHSIDVLVKSMSNLEHLSETTLAQGLNHFKGPCPPLLL